MSNLLLVENLSKSFGKKRVLDNISLSIKNKEIVGLVGHSGCGKSVFIKVLIGFLKEDSGKVVIDSGSKHSIGFSMQDNSLYDNLTLMQNLGYFAKVLGVRRKKRKEIIPYLISQLNLTGYEKTLIKNLSGGTRKRADIACALLNDPDILVLDEPFLGLDPLLVNLLSKLILELNKSGRTFIISSHTQELAKICTRLICLNEGKLYAIKKSQLGRI